MVDAPEKLWMTAEEQGWPGSFRSFRLSDLEHPEEYTAYVRDDLYEQVKRDLGVCQHDNAQYKSTVEHLKARAEAAERLAGARVKVGPLAHVIAEMLERAGEARPNGDILHDILAQAVPAALAEPAGERVVTDAMIEAGLEYYAEGGCGGLADHERREVVEAIIEAALAGAKP